MSTLDIELKGLQSKYSQQLTRDEALDLALQAADLHMKFLRIAKEGPEKKALSRRCSSILDNAEKIKAQDIWEFDSDSLIGFGPLQSSRSQLSGGTLSSNGIATSPIPSIARGLKPQTPLQPPIMVPRPSSPLSEARTTLSTKSPFSARGTRMENRSSAPLISSRVVPKKEQILLWQGSELHGSRFPPWETPPSDNEFERVHGEALFTDTTPFGMSVDQQAILDDWKRPGEALPPPIWGLDGDALSAARRSLPTMETTNPPDFVQDAATDCSVVASLAAAMARAQNGHRKLLSSRMFPYNEELQHPRISTNGKYIIRLNFNGCERKVVIDDRLPVSKTKRVLHVVDRNNPSLLWPALLEKAYLKARGDYDFPGSNSGTDLWILSGWIPEQVFFQSDDFDAQQTWPRMLDEFNNGNVIITLGTGKMTERAERYSGLAGEHDYAVLQLKEERGRRMLLIKNPWLNATNWKDQRLHIQDEQQTPSSTDGITEPGMTSASIATPGSEQVNDTTTDGTEVLTPGTFWMELGDVLQHFDSMYLNWNPDFFSHRQDIHFAWDLSVRHSVSGSFARNPQLAITSAAGGPIWMLLQKHFAGEIEAEDNTVEGFLSLYAFEGSTNRVYLGKEASIQGIYVDSPHILLQLDAAKGARYTIVVSEEDLASRRHTFTLSAFAATPFSLDEAASRYKTETRESSLWTKATAGGNAEFTTYAQNPQYALILPAASPVSLLLETTAPHISVHVKLIHGGGKRIYAMKPRDIIVDSASYRKGVAHAQIEHVDAGKYTIVCSTFEAGQLANYTLGVESMVQHRVEPVPKEGAGRMRQQLADASFAAGTRVLASPMSPRKLFRLNFKIKYAPSLASGFLVSTNDADESFHSPIRLTVELGRGPTRQILVSSGDGSFTHIRGDLRTDDFDLSPQTNKKKDLWLVLERMGGSEGSMSSEERISIEMFADAIDPVEFGVWRDWNPSIST